MVTGEYGAQVLRPLLGPLLEVARPAGTSDVEILVVRNHFFGGNIAVTGLLTGSDVARALADLPAERRYLLPDVCLSEGRFLDGMEVTDLPLPVEVVPSDGAALRRALEARSPGAEPPPVAVQLVSGGRR